MEAPSNVLKINARRQTQVVALVFLALGLGAIAFVCLVELHSSRGLGKLLIGGPVYTLIGLWLLLDCDTLTIDLATWTYRRARGFWPFLKVTTGSCSDFASAKTDFISKQTRTGRDAGTVVVLLCWQDDREKPFELASFSNLYVYDEHNRGFPNNERNRAKYVDAAQVARYAAQEFSRKLNLPPRGSRPIS